MPTHVVLGWWIMSLICLAPPATISAFQTERHKETVAPVHRNWKQTPTIRPAERRPQDDDKKKKDEEGGSPSSPVPEPLTLAVVGSGLLALALYSRRRKLHSEHS